MQLCSALLCSFCPGFQDEPGGGVGGGGGGMPPQHANIAVALVVVMARYCHAAPLPWPTAWL